MLLDFKDCKDRFGSVYQIEKAIVEHRFYKMDVGAYSDTGDESEIEILLAKYPTAIDYDKTALRTRRFFANVQNKMHRAVNGLTAAQIPAVIHLGTDRDIQINIIVDANLLFAVVQSVEPSSKLRQTTAP